MRNIFLGILCVVVISCKNDKINYSEYEDLKERIITLEDSLKEYKNYYHFAKIKPLVYPASIENNSDGYLVFNGVLVADGMIIGDNVVDLQVESPNKSIEVNKLGGISQIIYKPDSNSKDTINVFFKFKDSKKSMVFPVKIPIN